MSPIYFLLKKNTSQPPNSFSNLYFSCNKHRIIFTGSSSSAPPNCSNELGTKLTVRLHIRIDFVACDRWKLEISTEKSKAILFRWVRNETPIGYENMNDEEIQWYDSVEYLDVIMDKSLTWKANTEEIVIKRRGPERSSIPISEIWANSSSSWYSSDSKWHMLPRPGATRQKATSNESKLWRTSLSGAPLMHHGSPETPTSLRSWTSLLSQMSSRSVLRNCTQ